MSSQITALRMPRGPTCCGGLAGKDEARAAYVRALELTAQSAEREFLEGRLRQLD